MTKFDDAFDAWFDSKDTQTRIHQGHYKEKDIAFMAAVWGRESTDVRSKREIKTAIFESCSCGGSGPADPKACPACMVWHKLFTERE